MVQVNCLCPPKSTGDVRHPDGDRIELHERLDFRSALTARNAVAVVYEDDPGAGAAEVLAALSETYCLVGIRAWTVVDDKGKAVPVSRPAIRSVLFADVDAAMLVAEAADELYSEAVIAPLVARALTSSPPTPINGSTSATNGSSPKPPKRSRPSSISTTPTDGTVRMSALPAGGSRS